VKGGFDSRARYACCRRQETTDKRPRKRLREANKKELKKARKDKTKPEKTRQETTRYYKTRRARQDNGSGLTNSMGCIFKRPVKTTLDMTAFKPK
jgi:hypothetical protein